MARAVLKADQLGALLHDARRARPARSLRYAVKFAVRAIVRSLAQTHRPSCEELPAKPADVNHPSGTSPNLIAGNDRSPAPVG